MPPNSSLTRPAVSRCSRFQYHHLQPPPPTWLHLKLKCPLAVEKSNHGNYSKHYCLVNNTIGQQFYKKKVSGVRIMNLIFQHCLLLGVYDLSRSCSFSAIRTVIKRSAQSCNQASLSKWFRFKVSDQPFPSRINVFSYYDNSFSNKFTFKLIG